MFTGSLVAIVTPMTADGSLDWSAWDRLLDFHRAEGSNGIVVAGTTGESPALTLDEIAELTRRAVACCGGTMPVIVGTGTNSTAETIARTRALSRAGVDGVMIVTPYYNKPPQHGMIRHFQAAADVSAVPVILYNVPGRTAVDLLPTTVARLAEHPRIVALKEATPSLDRARELLAACPAGFAVLSGDDATAIEWIGVGGHGVISVTANVAPRQMQAACAAAMRGDLDAARRVDESLQGLHRALFVESSPIPVKWAVAQRGLIGPGIRAPLIELNVRHHETVRRAMHAAGISTEESTP